MTEPGSGGATQAGPEIARIEVRAERPYPVLVGRGVRALLAATVRDLGATTALLVHPPTLVESAEEVRAGLVAAGVDAHRVEIPDAEEGKALAVAGFCWEVCGRAGLTRRDVVIGLGGGAVTEVNGEPVIGPKPCTVSSPGLASASEEVASTVSCCRLAL